VTRPERYILHGAFTVDPDLWYSVGRASGSGPWTVFSGGMSKEQAMRLDWTAPSAVAHGTLGTRSGAEILKAIASLHAPACPATMSV